MLRTVIKISEIYESYNSKLCEQEQGKCVTVQIVIGSLCAFSNNTCQIYSLSNLHMNGISTVRFEKWLETRTFIFTLLPKALDILTIRHHVKVLQQVATCC